MANETAVFAIRSAKPCFAGLLVATTITTTLLCDLRSTAVYHVILGSRFASVLPPVIFKLAETITVIETELKLPRNTWQSPA